MTRIAKSCWVSETLNCDWLPNGECGPISISTLGKPGQRDRAVAVRLLLPHLRQPQPAGADQLHRAHERVRVEAGRQHDHVELVQLAVARDDPARLDEVDALVDELDVRALEQLVEAGAHHQALAHRLVVGREAASQLGVAHRAQVQPAAGADRHALRGRAR